MTWPASHAGARQVLAVGECMLELRHRSPLDLHLGYAGDTYNTAVYLHRTAQSLGVDAEVGYLTGLGDDPYSTSMRAAWADEGIIDRSLPVSGRHPGLYAVSTDANGERSFTYWRSASAAAALFAGTEWLPHVDGDLVHFSGISLQLMSPRGRAAFLDRLAELRARGTRVSFDTNFRPSGWDDHALAREVFARAAQTSDIVLATFDDEAALTGDAHPEQTLARYVSYGPAEVVVKLGAEGALVTDSSAVARVPAAPVSAVVDTTAAGDSFAGAYLAGRLAGMSPSGAAALGARTAGDVIQVPGAIIQRRPVTDTPSSDGTAR